MAENVITIKQIYESLAQILQEGLNSISKIVKFSVKTSYNYQEPSKSLSVISATMNFATNDVAPIENLEAYTFPSMVSFYCVKEYADEVMAILTKYISDNKGIVQQVGDYFVIPTYSTPSQSDVQMIGQLGESIKISMYIEYQVYQDLIFTNDLKIEIDGNALSFNQFSISKQKACDNDSVNNNATTQSIPLTQSLNFDINAFITPSVDFLITESLSLVNLDTTHTLTMIVKDKTYSYKVILSNSQVNGAVGGAVYGSFTFSVADGENGGAQ